MRKVAAPKDRHEVNGESSPLGRAPADIDVVGKFHDKRHLRNGISPDDALVQHIGVDAIKRRRAKEQGGTIVDVLILAALSHPGDAVKEVVIPLVSAIGGAVLGSMISYFASSRLAKQASEEVLKRDEKARHDQDMRAAHQVYIKLLMAGNMLCGYHKQVAEMTARPDGATKLRLSDKLSTFAGIEMSRPIEFTAEELSIYIAAKRPDYVDDLLLLARHHAINLAHLSAFAKLKTELHYEILAAGSTSRSESGISNTRLQPGHPKYNLIMARRDELDLFAQDMCQLLAEGDKEARRITGRFNEVTAAYLGGDMTLDFEAV